MAKEINNHHKVVNEPSPLKEFYSFLGQQRRRVLQFLSRVSVLMEYGYASGFYLDLFEKGVISRGVMLEKLDELDRTFNKHVENS